MSQEEQSKPGEIVPADSRELARRSKEMAERVLKDLENCRRVSTPQARTTELDLGGKWDSRATIEAHTGPVSCLAVTGDSALLVSGGRDGNIRFWRLPDGVPLITLNAHEKEVSGLAITPDNKLLVSGSRDGFIKLWSLPGGELLGEFRRAVIINCLSLNPEGKLAAGGYFQCLLWDLKSKKLDFDKSTDHIDCVCISNDSRLVACAGSYFIEVYGGPLWDQVARFSANRGPSLQPQGLAMSPNGKYLASCMDLDHSIGLWELPEGNFRSLALPSYAQCLAVSPDGRMLVAGTENSACLWSLPAGDLTATLEVEAPRPDHFMHRFNVVH